MTINLSSSLGDWETFSLYTFPALCIEQTEFIGSELIGGLIFEITALKSITK